MYSMFTDYDLIYTWSRSHLIMFLGYSHEMYCSKLESKCFFWSLEVFCHILKKFAEKNPGNGLGRKIVFFLHFWYFFIVYVQRMHTKASKIQIVA